MSAGIRKGERPDVALAVADHPVTVAGVFTRNLVRAAPVAVAAERVRRGVARAVLVNAGCANACTGRPGLDATLASTSAVAALLGTEPEAVLPASTGVIGVVLPHERIVDKAKELVDRLRPDGANDFAEAILTTDRWTKIATAEVPANGGTATVLGIGKGAGMIHPDVGPPQATMLVFLFTDADVARDALERALVRACDATFNACTVDGDTSTNDTVLAFASGDSGVSVTASELEPAFVSVCDAIARSMIADGEGATHVAEIWVSGLATEDAARQVARTVATSLLVKTALFGRDMNWGRLLAAAGRAGVPFDPERAVIRVGDVEIVRDGLAVGLEAEQRATQILGEPTYRIELVLGTGPGRARYLTSDLGHGYVDVNAGYRS
ncbi:MAG: bifunctional glutamate N-acetyltransferase/amino-acid acetyltransferase ArgJ [Pseudomonadota bacterium]